MVDIPQPEPGLVISYSFLWSHEAARGRVFAWPGFDVRPIRYGANRVHYGWLPPKLFDQLIEKFRRLRATAKSEMTLRD